MKKVLLLIILGLFAVLTFADTDPSTGTHQIALRNYNSWGHLTYTNLVVSEDATAMYMQKRFSGILEGTLKQPMGDDTIMGAYAYDVDGDRKSDLITMDGYGKVHIFKNISDGDEYQQLREYNVFRNQNQYGYGSGTLGDFDGDGKMDLFYINMKKEAAFISDVITGSGTITIATNVGNNGNLGSNYNSGTWDSQSMTTVNLDMGTDKYPEVLYITTGGYVYSLDNQASDTVRFFNDGANFNDVNKTLLFYDADLYYNTGNKNDSGGSHAGVIDKGDFNSDGIPDLVCGNSNRMGVYLYLGTENTETQRIEYSVEDKITLINDDGELNDLIDLPEGTKEPKECGTGNNGDGFSPTVLRISNTIFPSVTGDSLPDIIIGTDKHRNNDGYGRTIYAINNVKIDKEGQIELATVKELYGGGNGLDLDAGTLGDLNADGYDDIIFTDGNASGDFIIRKSEVFDYYNNYAKFLSKTMDIIDPVYRNSIENGIFTKSATVTITIPTGIKGTLYGKMLQGPPKRNDTLDLKTESQTSSYVQTRSIENTNNQIITMFFSFGKARPKPQFLFEFYGEDGQPLNPFTVSKIDIDLGLSDEITLVISNISWQKN